MSQHEIERLRRELETEQRLHQGDHEILAIVTGHPLAYRWSPVDAHLWVKRQAKKLEDLGTELEKSKRAQGLQECDGYNCKPLRDLRGKVGRLYIEQEQVREAIAKAENERGCLGCTGEECEDKLRDTDAPGDYGCHSSPLLDIAPAEKGEPENSAKEDGHD